MFGKMKIVSVAIVAMLLIAGIAGISAAEKDKKAGGDVGIQALVKTIPINGDLAPPQNTDPFSFEVRSGDGWDTVVADVLVSNIAYSDAFGDISIELVDPYNNVVASDTIWGTETHLDFNYSPGYDLPAGTWYIYVKGVDLDGRPGYDGAANIYN